MDEHIETLKEIRRGRVCFAEVALRINRGCAASVCFALNGRGFTSQGALEDATQNGYNDWRDGARIGAEFALAQFPESAVAVIIVRLSGLSTDTNPSMVAVTAARAVWKAAGVRPSSSALRLLDAVIDSSFERAFDAQPVELI